MQVEEAAADYAVPSLDDLFLRYSGYVATIGMRILGRDDEIDDLVQDVFLGAHRGMKNLRNAEAAKGWLATVTVRKASRRLKLRRLRRFVGMDDMPGYEQVAPGATPEQKAVLAAVYRVLDTLPANERVAWTLRHVQGYKLEEVAQHCECSLATAKRRIAAAHQAVRGVQGDG